MSKLRAWSRTIEQNIAARKDEIYKKDYKFYKIDRLEKIAVKFDEFSDNCQFCREKKTEIEELSEIFVESINGTSKRRAEFEKRNEQLVTHLKEKHGLVPAMYYSSRYSLLGLIVGTLAGALIGYAVLPGILKFSMLLGFAVGLIIGRIFGVWKDKFIKKNNLIL